MPKGNRRKLGSEKKWRQKYSDPTDENQIIPTEQKAAEYQTNIPTPQPRSDQPRYITVESMIVHRETGVFEKICSELICGRKHYYVERRFPPSSPTSPPTQNDQPLCDRKLDCSYSDWHENAPISIPIISKDLELERVFQDWHGKKDSSNCCLILQMCRLKPNRTIVVLNVRPEKHNVTLFPHVIVDLMCQPCRDIVTKLVLFFVQCEQYRTQYHTLVHTVLDGLIKDIRNIVFQYYDQPTFVFKNHVSLSNNYLK